MAIAATVIGQLGRDPETRQAGNSNVVSLSIASDHGFGDRKTTTWVRASIWGKSGEAAMKWLKKGSGVICVGELTTRTYTNKEGVEKTSIELENARWHFPPGPKQQQSQQGGYQQQQQQQRPQQGHSRPASPSFSDQDIPF